MLVAKDDVELLLSHEEKTKISKLFEVESSFENAGLSFIRISFFPHKNGYPSSFARYQYSKNMEELLDSRFPTFFQMCVDEWNKMHEITGEVRDIFPVMWRFLTPESQLQVVELVLKLYIHHDAQVLDSLEELDVWSMNGRITHCQAYIRCQVYPLLNIAQYVLVVLKPLPMW
jgi:hypothetical protein